MLPSSLRHTALDLHKRKSIETAQTAADLKLHLDKYQAQLKEAQIIVADKTSALQQQNFKYKRIQVRSVIVLVLFLTNYSYRLVIVIH